MAEHGMLEKESAVGLSQKVWVCLDLVVEQNLR